MGCASSTAAGGDDHEMGVVGLDEARAEAETLRLELAEMRDRLAAAEQTHVAPVVAPAVAPVAAPAVADLAQSERERGLVMELAQERERISTLEKELAKSKRASSRSKNVGLADSGKESLRYELKAAQKDKEETLALLEALRKEKATAPAPVPAPAPTKTVVSNGDPEERIVKLEAELEAERKMATELRAQVRQQTKDALARAASGTGGSGSGSSSQIVVVENTEAQRRGQLELESQVRLAEEDAALQADRAAESAAESERLASKNKELLAQLATKDQALAKLTLELQEALHESSHASAFTGMDSQLADLDARHDKLDDDMEMMEENLRLQALLNEKEEEIERLKGGK